jgi:hypothetical protein
MTDTEETIIITVGTTGTALVKEIIRSITGDVAHHQVVRRDGKNTRSILHRGLVQEIGRRIPKSIEGDYELINI